MKIATFYTQGYYETEVAEKYIIPSAEKLNISLEKLKVPSLHNWRKNTTLKARSILQLLEKLNDDITMIDADATFERYPELLFNIPSHYDIAFHYLDWDYFWHGTQGGKKELCSGTIMVRNTVVGKEIVKRWIEENDKHPEYNEQRNLENLIKKGFGDFSINIYQLPIEYLAIVKKDGQIPSYIKEPVIIHNQISRIAKRMEI
jgi:hypothetical protein